MDNQELKAEAEVLEITSCRFSLDWVMDERHRINLNDIWGVELHWRCDDWHVVVVTKEKTGNEDYPYITYELSHWVPLTEVKKLTTHPKITIKKIINYHHSTNFTEAIQRLFSK